SAWRDTREKDRFSTMYLPATGTAHPCSASVRSEREEHHGITLHDRELGTRNDRVPDKRIPAQSPRCSRHSGSCQQGHVWCPPPTEPPIRSTGSPCAAMDAGSMQPTSVGHGTLHGRQNDVAVGVRETGHQAL